MKYRRIFIVLTVLVLASLACQTLFGGGDDPSGLPGGGDSSNPTEVPAGGGSNDVGGGSTSDSGFPMTDDAYNVTDVGGVLVYYTKLPQKDVLEFYRAEYTSLGYTERKILTVTSDGVFSIVFDGDPSGKAVVIQSVDLGDGSSTVSISLEDV